ncbi:MAG: Rieske 2Fe-2S domain-containing protein [Clostridia bacterium]|nr:Rieske 2Fe-2S domain-containing protein [Clostridia bacterium]MBT7122096.1 Rieske 2Fe-2S domain-containing protein [Clostridia bacterium]
MMEYVKIDSASELSDGGKMKVVVNGKTLMLAKLDGAYYALDNKCPHMGGSLSDGNLNGGNIVCPRHGSAFDVRTGKAVHGGKLAFIKFKVGDAIAYPVKTQDGDVLVGTE